MDTSAILGTLSGVALSFLGIGLLWLRPRRPGAVLFAAFSVLWGYDVLANNVSVIAPTARAAAMLALSADAVRIVGILFLATFLTEFPRPIPGARFARIATVIWAILSLGYFLLRPEQFVEGVYADPRGSGWGIDRGFGVTLLGILPLYVLLYAGAHIAWAHATRTKFESERREAVVLAGALLILLGYVSSYYAANYGLAFATYARLIGPVETGVYLALFCVGGLTLAARALWRATRSRTDLVLAACFFVPLGLGAVTGLMAVFLLSPTNFLGVLRIVTVGLIAYGVLKFQVFDIDLRAKATLRRAALGGMVALVFLVVSSLAENVVQNRTGSQLTGIAVAGVFLVMETRVLKVAKRVSERAFPRVEAHDDYIRSRRAEVYEAALEGAFEDGMMTDRERSMLSRLQAQLGLAAHEAALLEERVLARARSA